MCACVPFCLFTWLRLYVRFVAVRVIFKQTFGACIARERGRENVHKIGIKCQC